MSINRLILPIIAGAALLCCALAAMPLWHHLHETPRLPSAAMRLALLPWDDLTLGGGPDHPFGLALAPDGRRLAFPASRNGVAQLWLRDLTTADTHVLPGTEKGVLAFWSPDGQQLGFFAGGRMKAFALHTEQIADLAEATAPRGAVWQANGDIIFAPRTDDGLFRRRGADGRVDMLTEVDRAARETSHRFPALSADGRYIIFLVGADEPTRRGVWAAPLDKPDARTRLIGGEASALVADDWLLYATDEALLAQHLGGLQDDATPALEGRSVLLSTTVGHSPLNQLSATVGGDGLVFGTPQPQRRDLRWIDRRDLSHSTLATQVEAWDVRIALNGGRVAVTQVDPQLGTLDVWAYEGGRPLPRRISQALDVDESAVWSSDGHRVAWVQARRTLAWRGALAELPEETVRKFEAPVRLWDWTPDGRYYVIGQARPGTKEDLLLVPARAVADPQEVYAGGPFNETHAAVAPDGHWIAYASDESGQSEIYVDSFPSPGHRARVSTGGGSEPRWNVAQFRSMPRAGDAEVFFRRGSELHSVSLAMSGVRPEATSTARLFDAGGNIRAYDASGDGQRFLVNVPSPTPGAQPITMVVHWQSLVGSTASGEAK
jgi:eukaryotic-like serine/threonine-protein kinase